MLNLIAFAIVSLEGIFDFIPFAYKYQVENAEKNATVAEKCYSQEKVGGCKCEQKKQ